MPVDPEEFREVLRELIEDGAIIVGRITLGAGSTLDIHAGVGANTYVGPRAALANATITLTDASGRLLGKGRTSKTGSYKFDVTGRKALKFPLTVRTAGGAMPSGASSTIFVTRPCKPCFRCRG